MKPRRGNGRALAASVAALLPLLAIASPAPAATAPGAAAFVPPAAPLILVRELRRPLPGGKEIVTRRRYSVTFAAQDGGYRVDGTLIDVSVDAPPALGPLAEIERQREDRVFPLHLDAQGLIVERGGGAPARSRAVDRAARMAGARIAAARLPEAERRTGTAFAEAVAAPSTVALTAWPTDLFHPHPGERQETRRVPLPDGGEGTVTTVLETQPATPGASLDSVRRTVVSEFAGTTRTTIETWHVEAARPPR